ncbi:probable serine/threonine-protein kinase PBL19, partial [Tanacetum coccineum]
TARREIGSLQGKGLFSVGDFSVIKGHLGNDDLLETNEISYLAWIRINVLGVVKHLNLVKLVGYCREDNETGTQLLLVYEYMPNRSVRDRLSRSSKSLLSWKDRMKVAQDAARGLAYLHEEMDLEIIFRDIKSSNVLLDDQWNAKLLDFGLARIGPQDGRTHVTTTNFTGTIGYAALEFISTGRLSSKSDAWSYGIFLYELITGRLLDKLINKLTFGVEK